MQKRTMKNTFSNKGESYIPVCVLVLFLSALVSVLILYIGTMAQVQAQKRDVKTKLDSVISEYAKSTWKDNTQNHELIHTFLIDLHHVVKTWNKLNHEKDVNFLIESIVNSQKEAQLLIL